MSLNVTTSRENSTVTMVISGQVTAITASDFDKAVSENLQGTSLLILNFKDCPYVSSAGLRVLMKAFQTLEPAGGKLKLINVGDVFMTALEDTYLDDVFDIERAE